MCGDGNLCQRGKAAAGFRRETNKTERQEESDEETVTGRNHVIGYGVSLLPASALAANEEKPAAEAAMTLTKRVSEPSAVGTYTITMEAQATGKETAVTTQEPMDVVLVLDVSGSMEKSIPSKFEEIKAEDVKQDGTYYVYAKHHTPLGFFSWHSYDKVTYCKKCSAFTDGCGRLHVIKGKKYDPNTTIFYVKTAEVMKLETLKTAVNGFIDSVKENSEESSIAVVSFARGANNISNDLLPVKDKANDLKNAVNALTADGATRADLGMQQAAEILKNGTHAKKIVVMFTDGKPTAHSDFEKNVANDAIQAAKGMKDNGALVFTVGIFDEASEETTNYMNYVSSNYPKAESMDKRGTGSAEAGYYMLISIPPKYSVLQIMGYLKGKSSLMIFDRHANLKYKYGNRHFWARGYFVDTVGRNKKAIKAYIQNQLQEDQIADQISIKEFVDPFTGNKNTKA